MVTAMMKDASDGTENGMMGSTSIFMGGVGHKRDVGQRDAG
jgi:hypothetical protein